MNPYSATKSGESRTAQLFPIFDSGEKFLAREKGLNGFADTAPEAAFEYRVEQRKGWLVARKFCLVAPGWCLAKQYFFPHKPVLK